MDSTVQTVQEVGNQVSQYRQMFENYLPDITKFGIKVVLAIVAFWVGSTVIKWIVKFVRKSLTKSRLDTGVAQFMSSLVKIVLYILLIFNISISFGVKESSLAALLGTGCYYGSCPPGRTCQPGRRYDASSVQAFPGRGLHHR